MSNEHQFYKEITLDSSDFRTGSLNRPTYHFNGFIDDLDYIHVERAVIPTTYYVFTSPKYTGMWVNNARITWPEGNYTPTEWIAAIQPQITSLGVTVAYSPITNKLTFTFSTISTSNSVEFISTDRAYELLGFNPGTNLTVNNAGVIVQSRYACNFSGPNFITLRSNIASVFNGSSIYFTKKNETTPEDALIIIPITENRNSVVFYESQPDKFFQWDDTNTRNIEIYCTLGNRDELIDFNGESFQIKIVGFSYVSMATSQINDTVKVRYR
jgi:hypothetical protein